MFLLRQNLPFSQKYKQHQLIIQARRAHHQIINPNKQINKGKRSGSINN
jgi:hypothetical protein